MKQGYLIKFIAFILALLAYLYLFDSSFSLFVKSAERVSDFDFSDKFLINALIWVVGFWGILVYLNFSKKSVRIAVWALFIASTFVNFLYQKYHGFGFSISNSSRIITDVSLMSYFETTRVLKFIFATSVFVGLAIFIGPLSIGVASWFPWLIVIMSFVSVLFLGEKIALQSVYIVPAVMMHKYLSMLFVYLKKAFYN